MNRPAVSLYTDALARAAISSTATGLTYTPATGVLSLTALYAIPLATDTAKGVTAYGYVDQDVKIASSPTFAGLTTGGTINGLTLASAAVGFTVAGGTTSKTLTVLDSASLNQSVLTTSSPSFYGLTLGTNPTSASLIVQYINSTATAAVNGTYYNYGLQCQQIGIVNTGVTNSGSQVALKFDGLRNYTALNDDSGILVSLYGLNFNYGHFNATASTPRTTNVYGISCSSYYMTGTIDNLYDIAILAGFSGGTATNHYGLWIGNLGGTNAYAIYSGTAKCYFGGNVGIGITAPLQLLDIGAATPYARLTNTQQLGTTAWAGTTIGQYEFYAQDTSGTGARVVAALRATGSADSTGGALGADIGLFYTPYNSATLTEGLRVTDFGNVCIACTAAGTSAKYNLVLGGGATSPVLGAVTPDLVSLAAVDASAGHRRLYIQSEAGGVISLGDDILNFAAATGYVAIGGTNVLTITATAVQAAGYKSSDGTAGATADVAVAKVGGGTRTLTFKNGLYTSYADS